ncbi:MAG: TonB-dependent receptor [Desulfuromonadales bacterium]|nr:TonB-dependent receptor [Desulfuromonadales bacterium]
MTTAINIFLPFSRPLSGYRLNLATAVILLLGALLLYPVQGYADQPAELTDLSLEELLQVKIRTVTGSSRYEQESSEAPARVSIIDADTIRRFGYRTLADALQGETGINMTYDRNYDYVGYRGLSRPGDYNTRVLVLLDGIRLNDEVYHQAPVGADFPLDMDLVERIEIIRGPSNSLYGNNAFFLTVNVITVSAGRNGVNAASSVDTRARVTGRLTAELDPKGADWSLLVSGTMFNAPGSDLYEKAYDTPTTNNGVSKGCDYESGGSFFVKAEKGDLTLLGGFVRRRKGIPTGAYDVTYNDRSNTSWDERSFADLSYQLGNGAGDSLKLRTYYNGYYYKERYAYPPSDDGQDQTFYDYSRSAVWGAEIVADKILPFHNHLVAGIDYHYALLRDQRTSTASTGVSLDLHSPQHSLGVFLQNEWRILPNLLLDLGGRYDFFSPSLHTFNTKAALIYKINDDLVAKYLFGKSFRAPNAYETDFRDATSNMVANPNLRQESMISHELVLEYYHGPGQRLSLTGFHYAIDDLISLVVESDGATHFKNVDKVESIGFEAEGEWNWEAWSGKLGYSYQRAKDVQSGKRLSNSPDSLVKAKLSREFFNRRLTLSSELQYLSQLDTLTDAKGGDYVLVHLTAFARDLLFKNLDGTISVRNLFNKRYANPGSTEHVETSHPVALIPQDGRTVTFKLSYRF